MNVPESWLRSFCNPSMSGAELAERLTMAGLEVEAYEPVGPLFSGVVVGEVLAVERHPNADKLTVCTVDAGGENVRVVCGAPNVRVGMKAPFAKVGAQLPGMAIRKTTLRGVDSEGMLCSARELGLSDDHSGLLELEAQPGTDARTALELDDHVFTLKLTPNRADALSVLGVAREVAALTGAPLESPTIPPVPAKSGARHPVRISAPEGCGRFTGRVIRNVNAAAATPPWMKRRLERAGQRSISALVDVTNYVMLELGRPLHVYDLDKLRGPIDARWGRQGEKVLLLNEQEVEVDPWVLCIADDSGAIGLGGIMGGESTKADEATTRNVFLESAFFWPEAIAGRARRYNFASDASHRFERGVDFNNNVDGIERATRLILDICGGEPGPTQDLVERLPQRPAVRMRVARAQKVIGMPLSADEMAHCFQRLSLPHTKEGDAFVVMPPSYRFDLAIEEDLIEEVARIYGFERIAAHPPRTPAIFLEVPQSRRDVHALRERLAAADYREVVNFSFVEPHWELDFAGEANPVRLLNPIASQQSVMRTSLMGSLVANVRYNQARKVDRIRVFEAARVFLRDPQAADGPLAVRGLRQPMRIAGAAYGPAEQPWGASPRLVDLLDVKGDVENLARPLELRFEAAPHPAFHPGKSARILADGQAAGWIGELHPRWQHKYELARPAVLFELDAERLLDLPSAAFAAPSKYPPVVRDMALVVDAEVPAQALLDAIEAGKPPIVGSVRLFDLYQGSGIPRGRKSLAFRVVMQHTEKTLTDAEADAAREALVGLLAAQFSATLRK